MSVWLLSAALAAATAAAPVELQRGEDLMARYKYAEARSVLTKARAAKGLDRASLLRILELQGLAAGQLRQSAPATAAFRELLVLDPGHKLDGDYAPRVTTPFMEAGQLVNDQGSLDFRAGRVETTPTTVESISVEVQRDPLSMARSVVFHVREGASWVATPTVLGAGRAALPVNAAQVTWWAELLGDNDAQLALVGSEAFPQLAAPPPPVVLTPTPQPEPVAPPAVTAAAPGAPVRTASYVVLGSAVAAAGVGVFFGVRSSNAYSQLDHVTRDANGTITGLTEREATQLASDAARDGTVANACFIGAGALAVGGALMWWFGAPVAAGPMAGGGGGGVVVSGRLP